MWLLLPGSVSAATTSQKLEVRAQVAAYHTLVVDDSGRIIKVISNSKEYAQIRAYRNHIHNDTLLEVTDSLLAQYWQLIPNGKTAELGTAYKYYDFPAISSTRSKPLLTNEMLAVL